MISKNFTMANDARKEQSGREGKNVKEDALLLNIFKERL